MLTRGSLRLVQGLGLSLACGLALASCSDGDPAAQPEPTRTVTSTPTPVPSETATTPVIQPPQLPDFAASPQGQEAFARYVVESWAFSLTTNDATPLTGLSVGKKPCQGCAELTEELAQRERDGWSVYPFEITIDRVKLIQSKLGTTARVTFDVPETRSLFDDGRLRNTTPAADDAVFTVSLRVEGEKAQRAYGLIGFTVEQ
ncbi:MAG TPA: hypothetical protein VFK41_05980 [Nocardioidaceae bacterium]|nr:hypothetical protein [Nocardioidaceae bacterium]